MTGRIEIEKAGNLFYGKIFQSSGKASKLISGALDALQSEVCRRFGRYVGVHLDPRKERDACNVFAENGPEARRQVETRSRAPSTVYSWHVHRN